MPTRSTTTIGALLLIAPFPARGFCTTGSPVDTISIADMVLAVETAAAVSWSPDGRHLAYQLASPGGDAIARGSIRVLEAFERGGRDLLVVPHLPRYTYPDVVPDLRWSPDGSRIVYATDDAYYTVPLLGGPPELLVRRPLFGSVTTLSPDQTRLAFIRDEALWTQSVLTGEAHLVAKQDVRLHSSQRLWWSPDSSLLAFLATTEDGVKVGIVSAGGGPVQWVVPVEDIWAQSFVSWAPDSRQMAIARLSGDLRRIELVIADLASGATSKIWEDRDERWVTHGYSESLFKAAWSRSGERLTFITDHEGYAHLYVTAVTYR